ARRRRRIKLFVESPLLSSPRKSPNGANNVASNLFSPTISFASVFNFRLLNRLPLHVRGNVSTTALKRNDVIDNVTLAPLRMTGPAHELRTGRRAALDPAVAAPFGDG